MRQDTLLAGSGHFSALRSLNFPYANSVLGATAEPDRMAREKAFQRGQQGRKTLFF
jgi:hypothetical protein